MHVTGTHAKRHAKASGSYHNFTFCQGLNELLVNDLAASSTHKA